MERTFLPPVALIGTPAHGLMPRLHAKLVNDAINCDIFCRFHILDGGITVEMPPLAEVIEGSKVLQELRANMLATAGHPPAALQGASFIPPALRTLEFQLFLGDQRIPGCAKVRYYDQTSLSITTVGPKKIVLGGDLSAAVDGLDALLTGKDGFPPVFSGKPPKSSSKADKGAIVDPPHVLACPAPVDISLLVPLLRITPANGAPGGPDSVTFAAQIQQGTNMVVPLPASGTIPGVDPATGETIQKPLPMDQVVVDISVDGGFLFSKVAEGKILKK
jgi:hypothetical protein